MQVAAMQGGVLIRSAGGIRQPARPGTIVDAGSSVVVTANGNALLDLSGGDRVALDQGVTLEIGTVRQTGATLAMLQNGRMHTWITGHADSTRYLTPNLVVTPRSGEFEV